MGTDLLIDEEYGIIQRVDESPPPSGFPPFYRFRARWQTLMNSNGEPLMGKVSGGGGYSVDRARARLSAIGEAIERYCSAILSQHHLVSSSWTELRPQAVNPDTITKYLDAQYAQPGFPFHPVDTHTRMDWIAGRNIVSNEKMFIPASMVFLPYSKRPIVREMISTGLACGPTLDQAIFSGICECIERDAFTITWLARLPAPRIPMYMLLDLIPSRHRSWGERVLHTFKCRGVDMTINNITTDIGIPTFLVIVANSVKKPHMYVATASHLRVDVALLKTIEEALGGYSWVIERVQNDQDLPTRPEEIRGFHDRTLYYASVPRLDTVSFLQESPFSPNAPRSISGSGSDLEILKEVLEKHDVESYYVDLTTSDVCHSGLRVVRVVCPQLAYMHDKHPMLRCERLYDVPVKLGYGPLKYINDEINPFP